VAPAYTRGFFGIGLMIGSGILFANLAMATFGPGGSGSFTDTLSHKPELWTYALLPAMFGWLFGLTHRHLEAREMVDKVRAEAASRNKSINQLNELLLGALTAAVQGIVLADANGVVKKIDVGATDMLGITGPEALGRGMKELVGGNEPKGEVEIFRRDGSVLIVQIIAETVKVGDSQQTVYLMRNVHEERTEQRMLAARAQELMVQGDIRKNFIAFVAQEIRSPLTAVTVLTEIVLEQARELQREEMITDALQIAEASGRVVRLADQILDLLKIEAGNISLVVEPVDLATILASSTATIEPKKVQLPPTLAPVLADRGRLAQVLYAMCEGLQVATIGSELQITASGEMPSHVIVSVRAGGQPASAKIVAIAFRDWDRDHDFDAGLYGMSPGFGLGLPLARRFARLMGGELTFHAKEDDRDLELRLVLPASRPTSSGVSIPTSPGGGSVLVVEQGTVMALAVEAGSPTLTVHRADNYHEALNALSRIDPNVMLLSMGLPQSKSWLLLSTLKAHPALWHVPLVLAEVDPATGSVYALPAQDVLLDPPQDLLLQRMSAGLSRTGGGERGRIVLFTDNDVTLRMLGRHRAFAALDVHTTANVAELRSWATKRVDLLLLDLLSPSRQALVEVCGLVSGGAMFANVMALVPASPSGDQVVELAQRLRQLHLQSAVHGAAASERLVDAISKARMWRMRLPAATMPGTVLVSALR
jgi:signal transduction histidine kinase